MLQSALDKIRAADRAEEIRREIKRQAAIRAAKTKAQMDKLKQMQDRARKKEADDMRLRAEQEIAKLNKASVSPLFFSLLLFFFIFGDHRDMMMRRTKCNTRATTEVCTTITLD